MDVRDRLRAEIIASGTRVDERLELLDLVFSDDGVPAIQARMEEGEQRLFRAIEQLRREAMRR